MHMACRGANTKALEMLIAAGEGLTIKNESGETPLGLGAKNDRYEWFARYIEKLRKDYENKK